MWTTSRDGGASVVLVSHGQAADLAACLSLLLSSADVGPSADVASSSDVPSSARGDSSCGDASPPGLGRAPRPGSSPELIVVDNASPDAARAVAEEAGVRVLPLTENLGFARAANVGLATAQGRITVFLNPDARCTPRVLGELVAALDGDPDLGLVAPSLVNLDDGRPQASRFPFPAWSTFLGRHVLGPAPADEARADEPAWLLGACLAGRTEDLRRWGGFDEDFFLYGEDMELCWRVQARGRRVRRLVRSFVAHRGNPLWPPERLARVHDAQVRFFRKTRGALEGEALEAMIRLRYGLRALGGRDASAARETLRLFHRFRREGRCAS